jgi:hypothetical protein
VDANELTIDQANEIIIKQKKEDNEKVVTTARVSKDNFTKVFSSFVHNAAIKDDLKTYILNGSTTLN